MRSQGIAAVFSATNHALDTAISSLRMRSQGNAAVFSATNHELDTAISSLRMRSQGNAAVFSATSHELNTAISSLRMRSQGNAAVFSATNHELDTAETKIPSVNVISERISIGLLYTRMATDVKSYNVARAFCLVLITVDFKLNKVIRITASKIKI
jgi:hypothetical protein